jgi:hypothetical protein
LTSDAVAITGGVLFYRATPFEKPAMAISDAQFDNEGELQKWAFSNGSTFFGNFVLLPGFRITTPKGKHGIPDGFAFNFDQRAWWVVECELLAHGVWQLLAARKRGALAQRPAGVAAHAGIARTAEWREEVREPNPFRPSLPRGSIPGSVISKDALPRAWLKRGNRAKKSGGRVE